jgi:peptide/nickel transport system permease protein
MGAAGRSVDAMQTRRWWRRLAWRLAVWMGVLLLSGLLAATLVRLAPGFGMDERLLDARLTGESREAIAREGQTQSNILAYYLDYLGRLAHGDLGQSVSLRRPVGELLRERAVVSLRSGAAGLMLAWALALAAVAALEWRRSRWMERGSALLAGALLCLPAAVVAVACVYLGWSAPAAIAAILLPRLFRYARNLAAAASAAPYVLAAEAMGLTKFAILSRHVAAPLWPELVALAGVSVSMAVGATIPVEALCDSPGVGHLVWQAALSRDLSVLVNVTLLITALTTGANLLADAARGARPEAA